MAPLQAGPPSARLAVPPIPTMDYAPINAQLAIGVVALALTLAGLIYAVGFRRRLARSDRVGERGRAAASTLVSCTRAERQAIAFGDREAAERWRAAVADLREDLPSLRTRVEVLIRLLELDTRLDLSKAPEWSLMVMELLLTLELVADAQASERRVAVARSLSRGELDSLVERGSSLGSPLEPLKERLDALRIAAFKRDANQNLIVGLWFGVIMGFGLGYAIGGLIAG